MRIIAGEWRSRKLVQPDLTTTRPMPDRLKQSIFDMLGAHFERPGEFPPLSVGDVFSGSGSMGLEALSRGAARCTFFERDRKALAALRENIIALGAADRAEVVTGDAWREGVHDPAGRPFDLIFLDPPYRDSQDASQNGPARRFLQRIAQREDNLPMIVLHHEAGVEFILADDDPWRVQDTRRMGSSRATIFSR